ncbi:helix-turn-helix domain-containing protein [Streptomyces sp. 3N207]|uniref:helix-turn-helix domain-containing protein n=1 Tax=Streptomyces sp. 3N207 TaxID=3457417 RepID=UPI003FD1BF0F
METTALLNPQVVLLNHDGAPDETLSLLSELRALPRTPGVGVLTGSPDLRFATAALLAGATGILLRDAAPAELTNAVRLLASGSWVLGEKASPALVDELRVPLPEGTYTRAATLSDREREVLSLLVEGLSNAEIGRRLLISVSTVKDHISAIYTKLGTTNRVRTAVLADRIRRHSLRPARAEGAA